jgi:LysM repeat protein
MNKKAIVSELKSIILSDSDTITYKQRIAIREAIDIIMNSLSTYEVVYKVKTASDEYYACDTVQADSEENAESLVRVHALGEQPLMHNEFQVIAVTEIRK